MQDISIVLSSLCLFAILAHCRDSVTTQAAWAAGWRLEETLTIMPMYALNIAAATIIGQNIGAHQSARAKQCGWQLAAIAFALNIGVAVFLMAAATPLAGLMSEGSAVRACCADYLRTICWTEPFFASWLIMSGCMQGAGYTRVPMFITIAAFNLVRLFMAWYLAVHQDLGASGAWIAMALSTVIAGASMLLLWKSERWQPKSELPIMLPFGADARMG